MDHYITSFGSAKDIWFVFVCFLSNFLLSIYYLVYNEKNEMPLKAFILIILLFHFSDYSSIIFVTTVFLFLFGKMTETMKTRRNF